MRHWHLGLLLISAGCNKAGYEAVAIRPTFGWQDGCATVEITGRGFGDTISATAGGNEITDIVRPDAEEDRQYSFIGTIPTGDEVGAVDIVVTSDDKESTIPAAYYYVACSAPGHLDVAAPSSGISSGDTISVAGCGIDVATMEIQLIDPAGVNGPFTATLTEDCGTGYASFTAPNAPDGHYMVFVIDNATDDILFPASGDPRICNEDTAAPCEPAIRIQYGGA